jgi:hypothetical protein
MIFLRVKSSLRLISSHQHLLSKLHLQWYNSQGSELSSKLSFLREVRMIFTKNAQRISMISYLSGGMAAGMLLVMFTSANTIVMYMIIKYSALAFLACSVVTWLLSHHSWQLARQELWLMMDIYRLLGHLEIHTEEGLNGLIYCDIKKEVLSISDKKHPDVVYDILKWREDYLYANEDILGLSAEDTRKARNALIALLKD